MHVILLGLGLLAAIAGAGAIALGIPERAFSVGSTMIEAGTIALLGGLVVIGLAAAVRRLGKIVELLETRPMPFSVPSAGELGNSAARTASPADAVEFAPDTPAPSPPAVAAERTPRKEPRASAAPEQRSASTAGSDRNQRATTAGNGTRERREDAAEGRSGEAERAQRAAPGMEAASRAETPQPRHDAAILKSGVIEGMAYTLYEDGSIDAELPRGIVRFESISALRSYLGRSE